MGKRGPDWTPETPRAWHEAWAAAHGGQAPRGLRTVERWWRVLPHPTEACSRAWDFYAGADVTRPETVAAVLDAHLATITTSKVAQAGLARTARWPAAPSTDTSCPSPTGAVATAATTPRRAHRTS